MKIIPYGDPTTPVRPKRHCWLRLRPHRFGPPFKRRPNAISVWRPCTVCWWVKLDHVEETGDREVAREVKPTLRTITSESPMSDYIDNIDDLLARKFQWGLSVGILIGFVAAWISALLAEWVRT